MNREVLIGEKKYRVTIGYGAYQRISALNVFLRAIDPDFQTEVEVEPDVAKGGEEAADIAIAALKSEELITKEEANELKGVVGLGEGFDFLKLLGAEQTLQEKVHESKVRILMIAVRDAGTNRFLTEDFIEYDLSPAHGEELFGQVMETFELIDDEVKDKERQKKS